MATNKWLGNAPSIAQVNTLTPASVTIGNIFTVRVGGVLQVMTATIVGTIGPAGAGNAEIVVTADGMSNSPKTVTFAVANDDTASQVAGKAITALQADGDVSAFFTISGSGANIVFTALDYAVNDPTMNAASDNDTCTGLTAQPTSAKTTAGNLGVTVSFTSTAATVANVTAGLLDAIDDSNLLEFSELTVTDNTTNLTLTAKEAGKPFTQSSSAAQGAGSAGMSLTTTTTTASSGPNDYSIVGNWSLNALPSSTDDVVLDDSTIAILYNLPAAFVTVNSFTRTGSYTGNVGLAVYDPVGYYQYRERYWKINPTTMTLGEPGGSGPGRELYDLKTYSATINIFSCGSPVDPNYPAAVFQNTGTTTALNILQGEVGAAIDEGSTSTIQNITIGNNGNLNSDVILTLGSGVTQSGTVTQYGGLLYSEANLVTVNVVAGTVQLNNSVTVTTLNANRGSSVLYYSNGTITTLFLSQSVLDNTRDQRAKTITNTSVAQGFSINDPGGRITFTNGIALTDGTAISDGTLDLGDGRTLTVV